MATKLSVADILAQARDNFRKSNLKTLEEYNYGVPTDKTNLINLLHQFGFNEKEDPSNKQYCFDGHSVLIGTESYPVEFIFDESGKFESIYFGE